MASFSPAYRKDYKNVAKASQAISARHEETEEEGL